MTMRAYGTLDEAPVAAPRPRRVGRTGALVGLACFALVACAGLFGLSSSHPDAAVDANRDKRRFAVTDGVGEKAKLVMAGGSDLRFVTFGFNADKSKAIPLVQGKASSNWGDDWEAFRNSLPEHDIAAAVYNFPYWVDDDSYAVEPILVTWKPKGVTKRELARAGYFLGAILLKTKGVNRKFALDEIGDTYEDFCIGTMEVNKKFCQLERVFHSCPYDRAAPKGPCKAKQCAGATYQAGGDGAIPKECCTFITEWCRANPKSAGCGNVVSDNVDLICKAPPPDETPTVLAVPEKAAKCDTVACQQACARFDKPEDTWKKCASCPTDYKRRNGKAMMCHPKALGFLKMRCCGAAKECAKDLDKVTCNTLEAFKCQFVEHLQCPALIVKQKADNAKAAKEAAKCVCKDDKGKGCSDAKAFKEYTCWNDPKFATSEDPASVPCTCTSKTTECGPKVTCRGIQAPKAAAGKAKAAEGKPGKH